MSSVTQLSLWLLTAVLAFVYEDALRAGIAALYLDQCQQHPTRLPQLRHAAGLALAQITSGQERDSSRQQFNTSRLPRNAWELN